jgi:hypothetical protein
MKKILSTVPALLLLFGCAFAQSNNAEYLSMIGKADSLYNAKNYKASGMAYSAAFKFNGGKGSNNEKYNAACSWALAGNADSAFHYLDQITRQTHGYDNYDHITTDPDLKRLYADKRWNLLIADVKKNEEAADAKLNKPLVAELKQIFKDDQGSRLEIDSVQKKYGNSSDQMKELWKKINRLDSLNLIKVTSILDKHGWLGPDSIGPRGAQTLFLVIQHSDIKTQEKYIQGLRDAVKRGDGFPDQLALMEDRVALREGKKQIYGSQIGMDTKTGKAYIFPIEDEANVDKRRAAVGLGPLKDYVKHWDIDYKGPGSGSK